MEKLILSAESIKVLASKFGAEESFIKDALSLTKLETLDAKSNARTIKEAEADQLEAENCCNDDERAAFRRWIELAEGNEKEILRVYERIADCEEAENERMLAVRAMAMILKK
jgi:hypothetical protein